MIEYCEHVFYEPHPTDSTYSLPVVDLSRDIGSRREGYALRHNREDGVFQIFNYEHPDEEAQQNYTEDSVALMSDFDIFPDEDLPLKYENIHVTLTYANLLEIDAVGRPKFEYGHEDWRCPIE